MRTFLTLMVAGLLLAPLAVGAQEAQVSLDAVAQAMGANAVKSIQITGAGGLAVDQILPLHGRIVPLAELHRTIGRTP